MMDQHQQDQRRAAAKAFMESLDQLHETLQSGAGQSVQPDRSRQPTPTKQAPLEFDLQTFEQAVADIEEYIEKRHQDETETQGSD